MWIGELGRRAGVSARTLRHYEEPGLLPARRRANGYHDYDDADLRAGHATGGSCPDSIAVYRSKLAEIDDYLARLHAALLARAPEPRCALDLTGDTWLVIGARCGPVWWSQPSDPARADHRPS